MPGLDGVLAHPSIDLGIIGGMDEMVLCRLVHGDAELARHVIRHVLLESIQVVLSDVQQHCDVRSEFPDPVKLETAELDHINVVVTIRHKAGETCSHIATHHHINTCFLKDVMHEQGGRGLSVTASNGHDGPFAIAIREFDLADHRDALVLRCNHEGCGIGNARALHHFVRFQYAGR